MCDFIVVVPSRPVMSEGNASETLCCAVAAMDIKRDGHGSDSSVGKNSRQSATPQAPAQTKVVEVPNGDGATGSGHANRHAEPQGYDAPRKGAKGKNGESPLISLHFLLVSRRQALMFCLVVWRFVAGHRRDTMAAQIFVTIGQQRQRPQQQQPRGRQGSRGATSERREGVQQQGRGGPPSCGGCHPRRAGRCHCVFRQCRLEGYVVAEQFSG